MTRFARVHFFQLSIALASALAVVALATIYRDPWIPLAGFALSALSAVIPLRFRRGGLQDERDVEHQRTAFAASSAVTWVFFVLMSTALAMSHDETRLVPTYWLLWMVYGAWLLQSLVGSTVAILLDRRDV